MQDDLLSLLLFIVSLILLSTLLRGSSMGYKLSSGLVVNHLLYMDDLKLYGRNYREIEFRQHFLSFLATPNVLMWVLKGIKSITQKELAYPLVNDT